MTGERKTFNMGFSDERLWFKDADGVGRRSPLMEAANLFNDHKEVEGFAIRKDRIHLRIIELISFAEDKYKPHWNLVSAIVSMTEEGDFPLSVLNQERLMEKFKKYNNKVI